ncbi:MAG: hypothetical protein WBD87_14280 [Candidatus Acidiferrales bacterium]
MRPIGALWLEFWKTSLVITRVNLMSGLFGLFFMSTATIGKLSPLIAETQIV